MPQVNPNLPTAQYKFMGQTVTIPANWKEGDTLSAPHAKFINRQLASVVGNLLGGSIRKKLEELQKAEEAKPEAERRKDPTDPTKPYVFTVADLDPGFAQAETDRIFAAYEPGVTAARGGGGGSVHDPVQSIADGIAWEKVKERLAAKNVPINRVKADKRRELVAQYHEKFPGILEQARAIFAAQAQAPKEGEDDFDIGDVNALTAGSDTTPGQDSTSGDSTSSGNSSEGSDAGTDKPQGEPGGDVIAGADTNALPDSEASSTAETNGADASNLGSSPANPGTVGTTEEGTGQGTPAPDTGDTGTAKGGAKSSGQGIKTPPVEPNKPGAFS